MDGPSVMAVSEQRKIPMRPIIPSRKFDLVEPIGIGTGLVESSLSLWKRAAERTSVGFGDFVRWAFGQSEVPVRYPCKVTGQGALRRQFHGSDGLHSLAKVYLGPLMNVVASDCIEACTLLPFSGLLSESHLLRIDRAWCPLCLSSMLSKNGVYEPLLWRLRPVTVCPIHEIDLITVCQACLAPQQEVIGRFTRVGCCNRCGKWLGKIEPIREIRSANEFEIDMSQTIMSLLAWTAKFGGQSHDGRSTLRKLLTVSGVREVLILKCGISPKTYHRRLPRLSVLATVASVSRQPLHRVIVGQVVPWSDRSTSSSYTSAVKDRSPRDWTSIEVEFEKIAISSDFINLKNTCRDLKISISSARNHFPNLVKRISEKKKILKSERAKDRKNLESMRLRQAFRTLIESGSYPSRKKLAEISKINQRLLVHFDDVIDEEWSRADGKTAFVRIRRSSIACVT